MRINLIAASAIALAMATSVSYAQSNPVPNHMATDKNASEDAGGGAGSRDSSGTKTMKPMGTDSTMTNSTTDKTRCKDGSNAKGALQTQAGKGDATPQDQACGENNN